MMGGWVMIGVVIANISIARLPIDNTVFGEGSDPGPNKNACRWLSTVFV